jgi:hypothetical protein
MTGSQAMLRALPIRERTETIIAFFQFAAAEFAQLVLEHTTPDRPRRRRVKRGARR